MVVTIELTTIFFNVIIDSLQEREIRVSAFHESNEENMKLFEYNRLKHY